MNFSEKELEMYLNFVYDQQFTKEEYEKEIKGHCHICGEHLNTINEPKETINEVCCNKDTCIEFFLEQLEDIKNDFR